MTTISGTIQHSEKRELKGKKAAVSMTAPKESFTIGELIKCTVDGFSCTLLIKFIK